MMVMHKSAVALAVLMAAAWGGVARAEVDIDARAREVAKSLVQVEYTYRNENVSREETGQGIVVDKQGVVLISGTLIPESLPRDYIKDIKLRLPGKGFTTVPAHLLGRAQNRLFAYVKSEQPFEAPVFVPGETADSKLGAQVFAVAMTGKAGGYLPYVGASRVKAIMHMTYEMAGTGSFGLTRGNSPVFDLQTGAFLGLTFPPLGEGMVLRDSSGSRRVELTDEEQGSAYVLWEDARDLFKDVPTKPFEVRRPWMAIDGMTGLEEEVRQLFGITQPAAVQIGSVVPGEPADKAGLKAGDVIVTVDGKAFSDSPVPELAAMHLARLVEKHKVGDVVKLGVLRDKGATKAEVAVTLGPVPRSAGEMAHIFSPRVGIATRDLVFADAYARKLPQDTRGVIVALVKSGAPAALGQTPLKASYLITKVDDQDVTDQKQFLELLKKEEEKADLKEMVFVVIRPDGETAVCRIDLTK